MDSVLRSADDILSGQGAACRELVDFLQEEAALLGPGGEVLHLNPPLVALLAACSVSLPLRSLLLAGDEQKDPAEHSFPATRQGVFLSDNEGHPIPFSVHYLSVGMSPDSLRIALISRRNDESSIPSTGSHVVSSLGLREVPGRRDIPCERETWSSIPPRGAAAEENPRVLADAEEEIRRFRTLMEGETELVCRTREDGTIVYVNNAFCRFFSAKRNDEVELSQFLPLLPSPPASAGNTLSAAMESTSPARIEQRALRADGELRHLEWLHQMLVDEAGVCKEHQWMGRDVTDERTAQVFLALVSEVTEALSGPISPSAAIKKTLGAICRHLEWDDAVLLSASEPSQQLAIEEGWNVGWGVNPIAAHAAVARIVLETEATVWIENTASEQRFSSFGEFRSVVGFPVRYNDRVIAVVECLCHARKRRNAGEQSLLEMLGRQVGNFRARRDAEERLRQSTNDLESVIQERTGELASALDAFANSEIRFRAMFESAPLGVALLSSDGTIFERNPTFEKMLGYPEGRMPAISFQDFVHPSDRGPVTEYFREILDGLSARPGFEVIFVKPHGETVLGLLSAAAMLLEGRQTAFIIAMVKDVTERRIVEEELQESESRFRTVFDEAPVGIALVDANQQYLRVNHVLHEMLGYEAGELNGKNLSLIVHPDYLDQDREYLRRMSDGDLTHYQEERRYLRRDGSVMWGKLRAAAVRGVDGRFLYSLRLVEDITATRAIARQMRMLAHTITSMNESVAITDDTGRIMSVNNAFLRTFGYAEAECAGLSVFTMLPEDTRELVIKEIAHATERGGWTGQLRVLRKNGELFPIVLSTSIVYDEARTPIAVVGIARDITERTRLQERLAEAERRRLADLRRFAISVQRAQEEERQRISRELHDDICQRLSGMKLNIEVLADELNLKERKAGKMLRGFRKQCEQTLAAVRRLSSNLRPAVLDDFGLPVAVNLLAREFTKEHSVPVEIEVDDIALHHLDPQVEIALYRITQEGLTNIACHARATKVWYSLHFDATHARMKLRDNGEGFDHQRIAEAREEGHGMGLISMRERAELLGGSFELQSAVGKGTIIGVTIPLEYWTREEQDEDSHRR